jgi:hypothetical protein
LRPRGSPGGRFGFSLGKEPQRRMAKFLHRPGCALAAGPHQPHIEGRAVSRLGACQQLSFCSAVNTSWISFTVTIGISVLPSS